MLHYKILLRIIGNLLSIEAVMLLLCTFMSLYYSEADCGPFALTFVIVAAVAFILRLLGRGSTTNLNRRESFIIVATTWIIFSALGMLPMLLSGACTSVTDAFFETISGFTTTGTSFLSNLESQPHALLFWRSLTQYVGGLGIVFFTLIILPSGSEGGVRLFSAEVTGLVHERLHPRIGTTVRWLFSIYAILTIACALSLWCCGMGMFDALNHAMTTMATGGFSTHSEGVLYFHSVPIELTLVFYMLIASFSFYALLNVFQKRSLRPLLGLGELRLFLGCIAVMVMITTLALIIHSHYDIGHAIRSALFNCVSLQSSTGFFSDDFSLWWRPTWYLLFFAMVIGGCAGSTAGGIKCIRLQVMVQIARAQFQHLLYPNRVMPVHVNGHILEDGIVRGLMAFVFWFIVLQLVGTVGLSIMGADFANAANLTVTCLTNIGTSDLPAFAPNAPADMPDAGKWLCSFLMLAGRLEIFPLLLPLAPSFWKNN